MNVALITGISGQDGSYLAELLLEKDYQVWGITRKTSSVEQPNISHLLKHSSLHLRYGDLADGSYLIRLLHEIKQTHPDLNRLEFYNLGAISHVKMSFDMPEHTMDVNSTGTLRCLEAIRLSNYSEKIRFYQASSSEMFGKVVEVPQTERTPFYPRSPYGVSKLSAHWMVKNYRESYGLYCVAGIIFNHFSELFRSIRNTMNVRCILRYSTSEQACRTPKATFSD